MRTLSFTAIALALTAANPGWAATSAYATTDLNLRAGPGPEHEIITVIDGQAEATVEECLVEAKWCRVSYEGQTGWAYSEYLTTSLDEALPVYGEDGPAEVPMVSIDTVTVQSDGDEGAALGGAAGAYVGSLVGGPAAVAAGALIGAATGAAADIDTKTITYVRSNPVDPVMVRGEVVRGARIPQEVTLYDVPNSELKYVALNNTTVVVDPEEREIIHILR